MQRCSEPSLGVIERQAPPKVAISNWKVCDTAPI